MQISSRQQGLEKVPLRPQRNLNQVTQSHFTYQLYSLAFVPLVKFAVYFVTSYIASIL